MTILPQLSRGLLGLLVNKFMNLMGHLLKLEAVIDKIIIEKDRKWRTENIRREHFTFHGAC